VSQPAGPAPMSQLIPISEPPGEAGPLRGSHWLTGMLFDPTGRVFYHEGSIYRSIYPSATARVRGMFQSGLIRELIERGLLIPTELTDIEVPDGGVILHHQRVPFLTMGYEWSRPQLRDAALAWLDLNLALAPHGLATIDAYWGNFAQTKLCQPTWIDFGSIVELKCGDQGLTEFCRYYRNPLLLATRSSGLARLTRAVNQTGGLNDYELSSLAFAMAPFGGRKLQNCFDRLKRGWRRLRARFGATARPGPEKRAELLRRLRDEIGGLRFPEMGTPWGDYHPSALFQDADSLPPDTRRSAVLATLDRLRPRRVIDLASNAGFYSFYAARLGADVLAVDHDEKAIERLYTFARTCARPLSVTCACGDVMRPPHERTSLRREADLVLALALTHHLTLSQGFSFPSVLDTLARHTTDKLLVEFMPHGLGGTAPKPHPLPAWYRREHFEQELSARFHRVSIVTENQLPQWRVLYLAEGKVS